MIGVLANPVDQAVVSEFFELFKTPWEFYRNDRRYEVLLCATDGHFDGASAKLILLYGGHELPFDNQENISSCRGGGASLSYKGARIPVYGDSLTFPESDTSRLLDEESRRPVMRHQQSRGTVTVRIGYDLFAEVRALLTAGQPVDNAGIPTLDLHIALLKDLIIESGTALVEIPPVPDGYKFLACLTHDVDHPLIRSHGFDHTIFGFLYRATLGTLGNFCRGRMSVRTLLTNWAAALKLPFVYMGFAKDFWGDFDERYLDLEKGLPSTFFLIPFKDRPGNTAQGPAPKFRAAGYAAPQLAGTIRNLMAAGCEVGLHGIDAWLDPSKGQEELEQIQRLTGHSEIGVRMHWLYYGRQSPVALEQAGANYDSSVGYNETIGYRSGTAQVYQPLGASRLLELPLHIMDTALFFPAHLNLAPGDARPPVSSMIDRAVQFGGCVTVNWHDRSLGPERCWGDFYLGLVDELRSKGAWFATAAETVAWFRKRRSATFETVGSESHATCVEQSASAASNLPGLQVRIHKPQDVTQSVPVDAVAS